MVDFLNNPIAEFNELRIAFTNLVTTKAAEYSETVLTFVSNHSSELLYGSLSAFGVLTFAYLLAKWFDAVSERDEYKWKHRLELAEHEFWRDMFNDQYKITEALEADVKELRTELEQMNTSMDLASKTIVTLEEERDELESDRDSYHDSASYWEESCDVARSERDELESERDELLERIDLLQRMTDTYKELVDELETPQLRLAA